MTDFILFGVGSAIAVEFVETCRRSGHVVVGAIANRETACFLDGSILVVTPDNAPPAWIGTACLCPLFTPANRFVAVREALALNLRFPLPLIDPTAIVASDVKVGGGSFVNAGVIIGACTELGAHVVINRGASIGHHGRLDDFASVGPGAVLAGGVEIGRGAMIGAGAIILPSVSIGEHAVVGAGAVVPRDVAPYSKILGAAGRQIEGRTGGFADTAQ